MLSLETLERTWKLLEGRGQHSDELRVRQMDGQDAGHWNPLFGVDSASLRHVLLPVASDEELSEDRRSSGVQIRKARLVDQGELRLYLDVVCLKPHLNRLFTTIVLEILAEASDSTVRPLVIAERVLGRWRELLSASKPNVPAMNEIVGLFGELWCVRELVKVSADCAGQWVGPLGALHDIGTGAIQLEVKATARAEGWIFEIHGERQLDFAPGEELYLTALRLLKAQSGGESIVDLVNSLQVLGADSLVIMERLQAKGIGAGIFEELDAIRFHVEGRRVFRVAAGFPRLVPGDFMAGDKPPRVLGIAYEIDLTGECPLELGAAEVSSLEWALANQKAE